MKQEDEWMNPIMVIPLRVPREVGTEWKVEAIKKGQSVQKWILERLEQTVTRPSKASGQPPKTSTLPVVKPEPSPVSKALSDVEKLKLAPVVSRASAYVSVAPSEVPMKKCAKCFDTFPVADMITDPKSGKLFCGDCVNNMRNQQ